MSTHTNNTTNHHYNLVNNKFCDKIILDTANATFYTQMDANMRLSVMSHIILTRS